MYSLVYYSVGGTQRQQCWNVQSVKGSYKVGKQREEEREIEIFFEGNKQLGRYFIERIRGEIFFYKEWIYDEF